MKRFTQLTAAFLTSLVVAAGTALAADPVKLTVSVDQPGAKIEPGFYGYMTEEINHSYDGGLYAELIQNRIFQDRPVGPGRGGQVAPTIPNPAVEKNPNLVHWWLVGGESGGEILTFDADNTARGYRLEAPASIDIDTNDPVNTTALKNSLRLDIKSAGQHVGVANDGYWGIPVKPNTEYKASFYARGGAGLTGPLTVAIVSNDGKTTYASGAVPAITDKWQKYNLTLKTAQVKPTADARFVISSDKTGSLWLSLVSLFPPTYNNRPNGNRVDIMQLLVDMKPGFLRYPGGNYLEGNNLAERWAWKTTLGPLEDRTGHMNSAWRYRSSDGMGMLEFLEWCEDMHAEPVIALYDGYSLGGRFVATAEQLPEFVQEGLDAIEFATGDASTKWGGERIKLGHPAPFKLTYVEIGNEENYGAGGSNYPERFAAFYDAIKAKYPKLQIISSARGDQYNTSMPRKPDVWDDHHYMTIPQALQLAHNYDNADRKGPKLFIGEWATRVPTQGDTCNLGAAVADAAFLTGLERNADVIVMNCYAPLFVNVNPGARQWPVNLIGYDTLRSYGSPSYYVQKMFSTNLGTEVLPVKIDAMPKVEMAAPAQGRGGRGRRGATQPEATPPTPPPAPPMLSLDGVYAAASRDSASGDVILKLVNVQDTPQPFAIALDGVNNVNKTASEEILSGNPDDVNSVTEPTKVAPKQATIDNAGAKFTHELPAHSVEVIRVKTK